MRFFARQRDVIRIAGCLLLLAAPGQASGRDDVGCSRVDGKATRGLDLANRTLEQPIGPGLAAPMKQKFVRVEITEVVNPKRIPLTFEVAYQPAEGEKTLLGSFGLFPPDNPGKFIVATSGKLRSEGAIVLRMVVLEKTDPGNQLCVRVGRISFSED